MRAATALAFQPRKTPIQARSAVTVAAIAEATIQVLLTAGLDRLTTNRVAQRAGVSVGTLYQYYPNKQALLYALLDDHMNKGAKAVELACEEARGKLLAEMLSDIVQRFVDAKMTRADISTALYRISTDVGGPALVKRTVDRSRKALEAVLQTAPDITQPPDKFAIEMMLSAMSGAVRSVLEAGATPAMVAKLRKHLVLLCQSYMTTQVMAVPCASGNATQRHQGSPRSRSSLPRTSR